MSHWLDTLLLEDDELIAKAKSDFFNIDIDMRFISTNKIGDRQKNTVSHIFQNEDQIFGGAIQPIILYYNKVYPYYLEGWSVFGISEDEINKNLPKELTKELFLSLVSDIELFINEEEICTQGKFALSLECAWDVENGLGIKFENWSVKEIGTSQIAFL